VGKTNTKNSMMSKKDKEAAFHQCHVIRWVEFEKQLPNDGDKIILFNPQKGTKPIVKWNRGLLEMMNRGYTHWLLLPPFV
jgi:hypothetical protein